MKRIHACSSTAQCHTAHACAKGSATCTCMCMRPVVTLCMCCTGGAGIHTLERLATAWVSPINELSIPMTSGRWMGVLRTTRPRSNSRTYMVSACSFSMPGSPLRLSSGGGANGPSPDSSPFCANASGASCSCPSGDSSQCRSIRDMGWEKQKHTTVSAALKERLDALVTCFDVRYRPTPCLRPRDQNPSNTEASDQVNRPCPSSSPHFHSPS